MRGAVLYGPRDIRFEDRETPKIVEPTDVIVRTSLMCVCGSDLWPYRGLQPIDGPTPMGHEYCGIVEEVGSAVRSVKPGELQSELIFAVKPLPPDSRKQSASSTKRERCNNLREPPDPRSGAREGRSPGWYTSRGVV